MLYSDLIMLLNETFEIELIVNRNNSKITNVKLLKEDTEKWNEKTLYIGNLTTSTMPHSIMLLGTEESPILPEKSSYSIIKSDDFNKIFNTAKDLVIEDLRSEAALFNLTKDVLNKKSILNLINHAADLLGNALILTDSDNKVLAYSTNYEIMDPLWIDNIERGYCSREFLQKVRMNQQMKDWNKSGSDTVKIMLHGDKQPKLVSRITYDGHVAGSLIMIEHHTEISHTHFKQLPLIGNILFDSLNLDVSAGMKKSFYSSVLYNLLDERENHSSEILNITKLKFPQKMKVVVAQYAINQKNRYLKLSVKEDLERIFTEGYSVIYKSYIIILVNNVTEMHREKLKELSLKENLRIGISWSFYDILQFKRHFYQSVTCLKQAPHLFPSEQLLDYTNFCFYDLLLAIADKTSLENYCHPALKTLTDYGQDFYLTLRTYLECNKNVNETADKLFIHRNTLNYRIKRIKELTGLNLNNADEVQCLVDSFRIEKFINKN